MDAVEIVVDWNVGVTKGRLTMGHEGEKLY